MLISLSYLQLKHFNLKLHTHSYPTHTHTQLPYHPHTHTHSYPTTHTICNVARNYFYFTHLIFAKNTNLWNPFPSMIKCGLNHTEKGNIFWKLKYIIRFHSYCHAFLINSKLSKYEITNNKIKTQLIFKKYKFF